MCIISNAYGIILTFDDISYSSPNGHGDFTGPYNSFNFSTNMDWIDTVGSSWNYGSVSGQFTLLNNHGGAAVITAADSSDFTLTNLWARIWGAGTRTGNIRGYNNGSLIWTQSMTISTSWSYFESAYSNSIDELQIDLGSHFLIDDLALNETTIPEPSTLFLFACICLGIIFFKKNKSSTDIQT